MKSKISAALLIGLMVLSSFAAFAAPAGAKTYTIANVIAWSVTGGDLAPKYAWANAPASTGRTGQVTGQIRDTDNQPWMFPSNVTIVNAANNTISAALLRMEQAAVYWPMGSASMTWGVGATGTASFEEFPEYEHYTFVGVNSSFNSSNSDPMNPATDLWYKTLVHYKVGPRWYTGQTNAYAVDADSSTTADVVIRPPPYYLCKTEDDYSVSAGQNVTITLTLFDVRNYLWQAQTGGNPCNDAKNRSAGYTITVYIDFANQSGNNPAFNPANGGTWGGGFYSAGKFWNNGTTAPTDATGKASIVWTAPNCTFWGWVNITAFVTADGLINVTWANKVTGSGANRIYVEPCEAQWTCKVMDGMGNGVCTNTSWVTLYTMNSTTGVWTVPKTVTPGNPTQPTSSPYCGSFAFGHIPVNESGTYAYVYANMTLGGLLIEGYSGNDVGTVAMAGAKGEPIWAHILHAGRTATGCVVLDIPCADAVYITASPTTILSGGINSTVTAQLYKNGSAYFLSGVDIEFKINNTAYATLVGGSAAGVKTVKSDAQGKATVTVQSKDVSNVHVLVWANVSCNSISNSTLIFISGWATLSGYVTDTNQVGIAGAKVTLWPGAKYNTTSGKWEHDATTAAIDTFVKNNPQLSNNGATSPLGTYTFERIPWGVYYVEANCTNLTATKTLTLWFAIVYINSSSAYTANIAVPNFVAPTPTTIAPTTTATVTTAVTTTATTTSVATTTATTVPPTTTTTSPGFGALLALIGLGGVAYLVIRRRS